MLGNCSAWHGSAQEAKSSGVAALRLGDYATAKERFESALRTQPGLEDAQVGLLQVLLETGAYQESSASNFNALPRPATVLVDGERADLVKRAETARDVWSRDLVPERLRPPRVSVGTPTASP